MIGDPEFVEVTKDSVDDPFYALGFLESAAQSLGDRYHSESYQAEIARMGEVVGRALTEASALKRGMS